MGTEAAEGQTADVTTPRTDQAAEPQAEATTEATTEETQAETAGAADSGLDNEALQAGAEPERGSEVDD